MIFSTTTPVPTLIDTKDINFCIRLALFELNVQNVFPIKEIIVANIKADMLDSKIGKPI